MTSPEFKENQAEISQPAGLDKLSEGDKSLRGELKLSISLSEYAEVCVEEVEIKPGVRPFPSRLPSRRPQPPQRPSPRRHPRPPRRRRSSPKRTPAEHP